MSIVANLVYFKENNNVVKDSKFIAKKNYWYFLLFLLKHKNILSNIIFACHLVTLLKLICELSNLIQKLHFAIQSNLIIGFY